MCGLRDLSTDTIIATNKHCYYPPLSSVFA